MPSQYSGTGSYSQPEDGIHTMNDGTSRGQSLKEASQISYIITTAFVTMLTVTALIMCLRSKSRLRIFACFATSLSLTTAIVGLLTAYFVVSPIWYWVWNVIAESIGIIALNYTIVDVGNGFYPLVGRKHFYWRLSMAIIAAYGALGLVDVALYIPTMVTWVSNHSATFRVCMRNLDLTNCPSSPGIFWKDARPKYRLYIAHQWMMAFTCGWACFYLFIPLIRHHRRGLVSKGVQIEMVAIGVWYSSGLIVLGGVSLAHNILVKKMHLQHRVSEMSKPISITLSLQLLRFIQDSLLHFASTPNSPTFLVYRLWISVYVPHLAPYSYCHHQNSFCSFTNATSPDSKHRRRLRCQSFAKGFVETTLQRVAAPFLTWTTTTKMTAGTVVADTITTPLLGSRPIDHG